VPVYAGIANSNLACPCPSIKAKIINHEVT
jgi:hypothetical protein